MTRPLVVRITQAVAEAEDVDPEDLREPLERLVSTDAIHELATHERDSWRLQFEARDHVVEVRGDGTVIVDGRQQAAQFGDEHD
jgi:hypothetical protein